MLCETGHPARWWDRKAGGFFPVSVLRAPSQLPHPDSGWGRGAATRCDERQGVAVGARGDLLGRAAGTGSGVEQRRLPAGNGRGGGSAGGHTGGGRADGIWSSWGADRLPPLKPSYNTIAPSNRACQVQLELQRRRKKSHAGPFVGVFKSQFIEDSSTCGDKQSQNGSNNEQTAPRTSMGYHHKGPSVEKWSNMSHCPPKPARGS